MAQSSKQDRLDRLQGVGINGSMSRGSDAVRERRGAQRELDFSSRFNRDYFKLDGDDRVVPTDFASVLADAAEAAAILAAAAAAERNVFTDITGTDATADYTVTLADKIIRCDATGGSIDPLQQPIFTITLPTAVGIKGTRFDIKKVAPLAFATKIGVACFGSETVDGEVLQLLEAQYQNLTVISDGVNWGIY